MIDFEAEIEARLEQFRTLNGRGSVKDSGQTLYEIIQLMLGMISQSRTPLTDPVPTNPVPANPVPTNPVPADELTVTSARITHTPGPPQQPPTPYAPHGLTKYGNPRRLRNR